MKFKESLILRNLSRDLPTTETDIAALKHSRNIHKLALQDYLEFLANFPDLPVSILRARKGPKGDRAFELK